MNLNRFLILLFLPFILNAKVLLKAPDTFYKGDVVQFSIVASGADIKMPVITSVDGNAIQDAGTSRHTTIINGTRSYQFTQVYAMLGNKDIHIPEFKILIDNKMEKTKSKNYQNT